MEVKHVNKNNYLDKVGFEHNGMDMVNLDPLSVNAKHPIVNRYSPFAYSLLECLDYDLSKHSGFSIFRKLAVVCMCQMDILSPLTVFDPGTFKNLRDRLVKVFESGVLVFAYSVTYLVNCQVKKLHGRSGILEEITRLTADGLSNNQVESLNV